MRLLAWGVGWLLALALFLELAARLYHRVRYRLPFHSRRIAEYPYRSFIEEADPPLYFRFKRNFRSPRVNFNRFRCRGPQPEPAGSKKRLLAISESYLFGVKLFKEEQVWAARLQAMLDRRYPGDWEVLNGGNPGYNSDQFRILWEQEMHRVKPNLLVLGMGANDYAIAGVKGKDWRPGVPWPLSFIYALERRSPAWRHWANTLCLYFLWRRWRGHPPRNRFAVDADTFPERACQENIAKNMRCLVDEARKQGAKVVGISYAPVVDFGLSARDQRRADSLQANWRLLLESRTKYDLRFLEFFNTRLCPELGIPCIDTYAHFRRHPRRFEMYFDLVHWNHRGMELAAQIIFQEIDKLGWWAE